MSDTPQSTVEGEDEPGEQAPESSVHPILLVPGLCSPARLLRPLRRRLERRLGCPTQVVSLGIGCGDVRDLAERVHLVLEGARRAGVDVVGHSMGGLVAAYLLKCLDHGARIRRVVTLGTPHRGLNGARIGSLLPGPIGRSLRQLQRGSPLLRLLGRIALPDGSELVSIAGLEDALVPPKAARLPEVDLQRNLELASVDHLGLILSRSSFESLVGLLGAVRLPADGVPAERRQVTLSTNGHGMARYTRRHQ